MVSSSILLLVAILVFDLVLSLWNAYASGVVWGLLRNQPGKTFPKVCAVAGLGLAFAGMTYATLIVASYLALLTGFLAPWDFLYLVSFDFLVFGAMIIGFGLVITAQSVAIAYRQRNFGSIAIAGWNVFSEIWDLTIYVDGFRQATGAVKGGGRDRANVYAILAVAVAVSLLVTIAAFRRGLGRSERAIADSPTQESADANTPEVARGLHPRHLRSTVLLGVVAVAVIVAAIVAFHVIPPAPQVKVQTIDVYAPDNVCGLNSNPVYYAGFTDAPGASDRFQLQITNFNATACTIHAAVTNTTGFALSGVQVPLTVPGAGSAYLNLTINLPASAFDGTLNIVYR